MVPIERPSTLQLHREVVRLIDAKDWPGAAAACARLNALAPGFAPGWLSAHRIAAALGRWQEALASADRAVALEPANPSPLIQRGLSLLALDRPDDARAAAIAAQVLGAADPNVQNAAGGILSSAGDQCGALAAYDAAVGLAPDQAGFVFNRAATRRFLGELEAAEADYDRAIALRPQDYEAYLNRSELRTQTAERNHVAELKAIAARGIADWRGAVQVHYALARECEDLGEYAKSFEYLRRGAALRRRHIHYDLDQDVATVDWIIEAYPQIPVALTEGAAQDAPVFILGLPRSGTTLVERILGSHSRIFAAGELHQFAVSLVAAVRRETACAQLHRRELVAASAHVDFAALGRDYLARAHTVAAAGRRFTDKMPLNYLYCGLIHRALPRARIVHLTRHPLAACYAIYKTLFKDAYPFSYDLDEIGGYYIAYRRLMDHWQAIMPGVIHDLRYEDLVADQLGETRKLLAFCGLEWQDACAQFHRNPAATTTASAAQVRRPIYASSVSQWRHYEAELAPLRERLAAAGLDEAP